MEQALKKKNIQQSECSCQMDDTRTSRLVLVPSGKTKLLSQLLLHGAQRVLVRTAGCPMVAFANTTGHNLLSFKFVHGILILILSIQVLTKIYKIKLASVAQSTKISILRESVHFWTSYAKILLSGSMGADEDAKHFFTSLLEMKVMKTSSLTVVVATLGPGGSNSEFPNFFQFWNDGVKLYRTFNFAPSGFHLINKYCFDLKWTQTFLLATAFEAFLVSILKVRTI